MIKYFFTIGLCGTILFSACKGNGSQNKILSVSEQLDANRTKDTAKHTTIRWIDSTQNFGTVKKGTQVKLVFHFENTGTNPLYITSVQPSCGCTVADYSKEAILPGKQGSISAVCDSNHGVPGSVRKSIIVSSNTSNDPNYVLAFTGEIAPEK